MVWILVTFIVAITATSYLGLSLPLASAIIAAALLLASLLFAASGFWLALLWIVVLAVLAVLNIPQLRQRLISAPALRVFRRMLPPLSDTEREAMEAGDVWWDGELFSGDPDWKKLLNVPPAGLSEREQAFLDGPVEEACRMIDDWQITHELKDLPPDLWDHFRKHRFFGMIIPEEYGGLGFSATAHSAVVVKLATRSITAAVTVMVPNSLGPGELLLHYGTDEQKQRWLPRLADGRDIPCFALTSPLAGSDAGAIPDYGIVCKGEWRGKKDVLGVRLTFDKRYITLAPVATLIGLAFRMHDPDGLLGEEKEPGLSLILIPRDTPGLEAERRHWPLDVPFMNGPVRGKDVFVPLDYLIGGPDYAGKGWRMLMEALAAGRGISLPAMSTGGARMAAFAGGAYAAVRVQFNLPIGRFEGVQEALARIGGLTYVAAAARNLTLAGLDQGVRPAVVSGIMKYHLTEILRATINDVMDVQGGKGIVLGPRNIFGRVYQSLPVAITVEGANILTRSMIIFGQGAIRCHPFVLKEMEVAGSDAPDAVERFDELLFAHLGHLGRNKARAFLLALTGSRLAEKPVSGPHARYFQHFARFSAALAFATDMSMGVLGGSLKRHEHVSARLGDVLSYLYLGSAVLKRFEDQQQPKEDEPLMRFAADWCLWRMQESLRDLCDNYPVPIVGRVLKWIIFPLGCRFRYPADRIGRQVAMLLQDPASKARARLTRGIYLPPEDKVGDPVADLMRAFAAAGRLQELQKRIRKAMKERNEALPPGVDMAEYAERAGIISADDAAFMKQALKDTRAVIDVDDFAQEELTCRK